MFSDINCPGCRKPGTLLVVTSREATGHPASCDVCCDIELACESCGYGRVVISTFESPLEWLRALFDFLPTDGGSPVRVIEEPDSGSPRTFDHGGRSYEVADVLIAVNQLKPGPDAFKVTCFLVKVQGGEVVLRREEGVPTGEGSRTVWFLTTADLGQAASRANMPGLKPSPEQYASWRAQTAYRQLYKIERILRGAILKRFSAIETLFDRLTVRDENKDTTLLKKLQSTRQRERSAQVLSSAELPLIEYIEWTDLIKLIDFTWEELFPGKARAKSSLLSRLNEIRDVRNKVMHMREAASSELELLTRSSEELARLFDQ